MRRLVQKRWFVIMLMAFVTFHLSLTPSFSAVQQQKKTAVKKTGKSKKSGKTGKTQTSVSKKKNASKQPSVSVKSLKNEQAQVRKQIQEQERRLRANEQDVKKRLQNLMVLNNEITDKRKTIDTIRQDISRLNGNIHMLENQLVMLKRELEERKARFERSMRYMHRNRSIQSQMMFIFSANNFSQMYRRLRFVREYASYQQAQGEAVMSMQRQVTEAFDELKSSRQQKSNLLYRGEQEKRKSRRPFKVLLKSRRSVTWS